MQTVQVVQVKALHPLDLREIIPARVEFLKKSIEKHGYISAYALIVRPNGNGYDVIDGNHRLRVLLSLGIPAVPGLVVARDADPVDVALKAQGAAEGVQPWDFLDRAFLVKRLCRELGTQEKVAEKLGWSQPKVSDYKQIADLLPGIITIIRNSVISEAEDTVIDGYHHGDKHILDRHWSVRWFRHICALPRNDLKLEIVSEIARAPTKWKEKDVASWCSRARNRWDLNRKIAAVFAGSDDPVDILPDTVRDVPGEYQELVGKVWAGAFDSQPDKAVERAKAILKSVQLTDQELMADFGYEPQVFTIWKFNGRDERFGIEHPSNIPAGIVFNTLYHFTAQGGLVIDPMAGGGVVVDVCKVMKRRVLAFDVEPVRPDIGRHNALDEWPVEPGSASLVFLDPPYWKQKRGEYKGERNLADMSLDGFYAGMFQVFRRAFDALRGGGCVAVIVGPTQENGIVYDHALEFAGILNKAGFTYLNRVIVPYTTQQVSGFDVAQARKGKYPLKLHRDLLVYRKGNT